MNKLFLLGNCQSEQYYVILRIPELWIFIIKCWPLKYCENIYFSRICPPVAFVSVVLESVFVISETPILTANCGTGDHKILESSKYIQQRQWPNIQRTHKLYITIQAYIKYRKVVNIYNSSSGQIYTEHTIYVQRAHKMYMTRCMVIQIN